MKFNSSKSLRAVALTLATSAAFSSADAAIVFTMNQVGGDVVVTSTGGVLNPLIANGAAPDGPVANSNVGPSISRFTFAAGFDSAGSSSYLNAIVSGPTDFGPTVPLNVGAFTTDGTYFAFFVDTRALLVSGGAVFTPGSSFGAGAGATYAGKTIQDLGFTPGTYTWTLDARFNGDTITLNVIPEPSTALLSFTALGILLVRRRRW